MSHNATLHFYIVECVTRYNLSLDESAGESSLQNSLQWAIYLVIQLVVGLSGVEEDTSFKFHALWFSGLMTTVALTLGQMKV